MRIKISIISNVEGMKRIEHLWDAFISEHGGCPFLLSGFVNQFLRPNAYNYRPRILVFSTDNEIVGAVPVEIRDKLFYRECIPLLHPWFPADLIFDPKYVRILLRETLTILFRNMGCNFVDFRLPAKSHYFPVFKQVCEELGIDVISYPREGRATVPVNGSWVQFEKSRRHLRREVERTGRRMTKMGQLNITLLGKKDDKAEAFKRILVVEKASWKSLNQHAKKFKVDPSILFVLNGCVQTSLTIPLFNWGVALLELNGTDIAHSMFLEYNGHAYICKTSFNDRYRKYGPGIYINYAVVRELMSKTDAKVIDFMTDLPFSHKWASVVVPVNRLIISRKGIGLIYLIGRIIPTRALKDKGYAKSFNKLLPLFVSECARYLLGKSEARKRHAN